MFCKYLHGKFQLLNILVLLVAVANTISFADAAKEEQIFTWPSNPPANWPSDQPVLGAVHLASGFLLQEMLGCQVKYIADAPPQVVSANRTNLDISIDEAFSSDAFKKFDSMTESLKERFGFLLGDVNWGGVLNMALDLRGDPNLTGVCCINMDANVPDSKVSAIFSTVDQLRQKLI